MESNIKWIDRFFHLASWAEKLHTIDERVWFQPIKEGKWSIAEIISHLEAWDHFILEGRLYKLDQPGEMTTPDVEEMNRQAAFYALSGVSKDTVINRLVASRQTIVEYLKSKTVEELEEPVQIGNQTRSIKDYITGLTEHDEHHIKQIEDFLSSFRIKL